MSISFKIGKPVRIGDQGGYFPVMHKFADGSLVLTAFNGEDRVQTASERKSVFGVETYGTYPSTYFQEAREKGIYPHTISWQSQSRDGGKTWKPYGGPILPCGTVLKDGSSIFISMLTDKAQDPNKGTSFEQARAMVWRTKDNGKTWKGPSFVPVVGPRTLDKSRYDEYNYVAFTRSIVECDDGSLLITANTFFQGDTHFRVAVYRSTDAGESFSYYSTVAQTPSRRDDVERRFEGYDEPVMKRLEDGTLICVMRTGSYLPLHQAFSRNNGATWTEPQPIGSPGVFPDLVMTHSKVLVLSSGRPDVYLMAKTAGENWGYKNFVYRSSYAAGFVDGQEVNERSCCYTSLAETAPDSLVMVMSAPGDLDDVSINDPWDEKQRKKFAIYAVPVTIIMPNGGEK